MLKQGGDEIPDERLLNWLDAACGEHAESLLENDDKQVIQQWLQSRPHRYYALLDAALKRYANKQNRMWPAEARLHGTKAPTNKAAWWLAKAQATEAEAWAREYFVQALYAIPDVPEPGLEEMLVACENLAASRGGETCSPAGLLAASSNGSGNWKKPHAGRNARGKLPNGATSIVHG